MIMQNTTFYIPVKNNNRFIERLKHECLSVLDKLDYVDSYKVRKLITPPGYQSEEDIYAVSVLFDTMDNAEKWVDEHLGSIVEKMQDEFGVPGTPLYFLTYMEEIL